jgi:hypothetical protein
MPSTAGGAANLGANTILILSLSKDEDPLPAHREGGRRRFLIWHAPLLPLREKDKTNSP